MTHLRAKTVMRNVVEKSNGSPAPFIGLESIQSGTGRLDVTELPIKQAADSLCHRPGDVLFSKLRPYLAKSILANTPGTGTGELLVLRPHSQLDPRFLLYVTLSRPWLEWAEMTSYGSKMPRTSWDAIGDYSMWLPSIEEQRRIADFLDAETARIDTITSKKDELLRLLEERAIALTSKFCLRGLDASIALEPSTIDPIGVIPKHWKVTRNKNIFAEIIDLSKTGEEDLLTVSHLTGVSLRSEKTVNMFMAESLVGYKKCKIDDLVINTLWAWMGALGISRDDGIVSPAYGVYRLTDRSMIPDYLDLLYRTPEYVCEMTRYSKGVWTSRLRLYPESFLALKVPLPPRAEQQAIVSAIENELAPDRQLQSLLASSNTLLGKRRQALVTAAVTGQFDVTTGRGADLS